MANQYPNSGALFREEEKRSDKAPDWKGYVELDKDMLKVLIEFAKTGKPIKLELGGWIKEGRKGEFVSLKASKPYEKPAGAPSRGRDLDDDIPF